MLFERKKAWIRVLSAIQTSESMEAQVLDPLLQVFAHEPTYKTFLHTQANDEKRHSEHIKHYLLQHFDYVKQSATLSDDIFYKAIFPAAQTIFNKHAVSGLGVLLFYELFSVGLYRELKKQAKKDGLEDLVHLISDIMRDEARHIKGVRRMIEHYAEKFPPLKKGDRGGFFFCFLKIFKSPLVPLFQRGKFFGMTNITVRLLLKFSSLDVSFEKYAVHNREIRNSLITLGIDPEIINHYRKSAVENVKSIIKARSTEEYA